jgi:hypothetical protein
VEVIVHYPLRAEWSYGLAERIESGESRYRDFSEDFDVATAGFTDAAGRDWTRDNFGTLKSTEKHWWRVRRFWYRLRKRWIRFLSRPDRGVGVTR